MSMLTLPTIVTRPETAYVAIRRTVGIPFQGEVDAAMPRVAGWLDSKGVDRFGPAIFRYTRIAMPELDIEFGFVPPVPVAGEGEIQSGTLPAGSYATLTHVGHYQHLMDATAVLIGWAREKGIRWDSSAGPDGEHFASRFELYPNGPMDTPDPDKWETQIFIKVRE